MNNSVNPRHADGTSFSRSAQFRSRRGWSSALTVLTLLIVSVPLAVWRLPTMLSGETTPTWLTAPVISAPFVHRVLERGEIESSSSVEVRCEVRSRSSAGVNILEIVPEGTWVEKGAFLCRLDDSALQMELVQQQIVCSNSYSLYIEAQATLAGAELALKEYQEGSFREQEEQQESAVFVARENERRAEEYLRYSQRLAERGYVSEVQLEADRFAVEKNRKDRETSETRLEVLRTFTKEKMLVQLRADIDTARARLESRRKTRELDDMQLREIELQIAKCVLNAPVAGQVVYANDADRRGSSGDLLITEGKPVRERQVIIRLPDPDHMRVMAKVNESRISFVRPGLPAQIVLDAVSGQKLTGTVTSVSEYPLPSLSVYTSHIKEYAVEIQVNSPPRDLRAGMNAAVEIHVEKIDSAVQVPIQAVIERSSRFFCAVQRPDGTIETREVKPGSTNEEFIVIGSGLRPGELVALGASDLEALLNLPDDSDGAGDSGSEPVPTLASAG